MRLHVPFTRGDIVAKVHEHGTVIDEQYDTDGTILDVRVPARVAQEVKEFIQADEFS